LKEIKSYCKPKKLREAASLQPFHQIMKMLEWRGKFSALLALFRKDKLMNKYRSGGEN
jgi:hypothetical protein